MTGNVADIESGIERDSLAVEIANLFEKWDTARQFWVDSRQELKRYVYATDTRSTTNSKLPWKNTTVRPKLTQIRDNLHANYKSALFPTEDWFSWSGDEEEAVEHEKAKLIESYMMNKLAQSGFTTVVDDLLYDYIDDGNAFAMVDWKVNKRFNPALDDEETVSQYPVLKRINPNDIVFNPLADDFRSSPKIIRTIMTFGEVVKFFEDNANDPMAKELMNMTIKRAGDVRKQFNSTSHSDRTKNDMLQIDGFGNFYDYLTSGYVEVLTFYGDLYDVTSGELLRDHVISVLDRSFVVSKKANPSWSGKSPILHVTWRKRQDSLYGMGPLDNLVGMQYRIDHLENLRADVFDLIAHPIMKIRGDVEDFEYAPMERIYVGDEGDVTFLNPDSTALNADTQIQILEQAMEQYAGAPREAMGFRTAGEKTAFEVQSLQTAASRIFQVKLDQFEKILLEPSLEEQLILARQNMDREDVVKTLTDDGAVLFENITKEDLTVSGKLKPKGASHFAQQNKVMQNLANLGNSALYQDPTVNTHISGFKIAQMIEEALDFDKFKLVSKNIRVDEQADTQRIISSTQAELQAEQGIVPEGEEPVEEVAQ